MQKENKPGQKVISPTEERKNRTRKRISNTTGSEDNMTSEQRNKQHSGQQPAR